MDKLKLSAYEIIEVRKIADIESMGYILRHKKSGARVCVISNEDDNKVFSIGFRTPPEDETGVPHIIEHTTLCGSDKFPVKDPFIELAKGSLNTFLNAMTYPEKTLYPVASYNERDFKNLMEVYLDAVFHPNITKYKEIFMQEGWHYELESEDAPLTINGVVYNEMKGAYSSPDEVLETAIMEALFPDNTYSKNSGGNPEKIPELTYENYLAFYHKYYHPCNSYIYLYGDMDIEERLTWLDEEYLSHYDANEVEVHSQIQLQKPFDAVVSERRTYPITEDEPEEKHTYLSYNKVVGTVLDRELYQAFSVLDYVLVSAPGAPVRQALIDAGIGEDVYGSFEDGMLQPMFSIVAKNADESDQTRFVQIIEETLQKLVKEGLNQDSLLAGINSAEFRFREADYGQFPKGLLYGLQCMESWLFDDTKPFIHLECLDTLQFLREQIKTGYFEDLIQKYLLDNAHGAVVVVAPEKGLNRAKEQALAEKLAAYKAGLSDEEVQALIAQTRHLREYQEEPSKEEDLLKIPMLGREDMKKEAMPFSNKEENMGEIPVVRHEAPANGIDYITLMFECNDIAEEEVPYLGLLRAVLGYVNTRSYSYADLANAINIYTGGITSGVSMYPDLKNHDAMAVKFEIRMKVLESNLEHAMKLAEEILNSSDLHDTKRLAELIAQVKSRLQVNLSSSGHTVAAMRALSYESVYAFYNDATIGIAYNQMIRRLDEQMKENPQAVAEKLQQLIEKVFVRKRMLVSFTGEEGSYEKASPIMQKYLEKLPEGTPAQAAIHPVLSKKNEGFTDASQIQYVARSGNFISHGYAYHGTLKILKMILSYEYLWMNIRVKGGAYGCMSSFLRTGDSYFVSYRDPNLAKTNAVYEKIPEYVASFDPDERDMTKYIIGTFGALDTPLNPEAKGSRSMAAYLEHLTYEEIQKEIQMTAANFKSGFVTIIGRPNVGKSTLMNRLIGQKIAITSNKPQTTRNRIQTVYTDMERGQIVFLDTPGIHKAKNKLGEYMVNVAEKTLNEVDVVLWLVEPSNFIGAGEQHIVEQLKKVQTPVILVINKVDTVEKDKVLEFIDTYRKIYDFAEIIPTSALRGQNVDDVIDSIFKYLPYGPQFYDEDTITDQPERAICAEIIREKALHALSDEVPHGIAVAIDQMKPRKGGKMYDIDATIVCERDSHKGIIIGKQGSMLKKIGTNARYEMEKMLDAKVNLKLWVKVKKDWRDSDFLIKNFGYREEE